MRIEMRVFWAIIFAVFSISYFVGLLLPTVFSSGLMALIIALQSLMEGVDDE